VSAEQNSTNLADLRNKRHKWGLLFSVEDALQEFHRKVSAGTVAICLDPAPDWEEPVEEGSNDDAGIDDGDTGSSGSDAGVMLNKSGANRVSAHLAIARISCTNMAWLTLNHIKLK
jgi:hypothetical protein